MTGVHLVRVGAMADVGAFGSGDATRYPRGSRVIVRTRRGLEIGQVLTSPDDAPDAGPTDGTIVRGMTVEDELLEARLHRNRRAASEACAAELARRSLPTALLDVEHLFDGQTLVFYFLGELPAELDALTAELAEAYDAKAQFRSFAETVTAGCGPGCGTDEATGGGCDSCATGCAISGACGTRGSSR
ncbi:MAG: PSP1 C-terminal domain-containing protein [Pirellulales bacterium]